MLAYLIAVIGLAALTLVADHGLRRHAVAVDAFQVLPGSRRTDLA